MIEKVCCRLSCCGTLVWILWDMTTNQIACGGTVIANSRFQKSPCYKEEVLLLFTMNQCCKEDMDLEVLLKFESVARSVIPL